MSSTGQGAPDESSKRAWAKWLGVAGAAGLLLWAAYMLLNDKVPQVCHDEVASSDAAKKPADLVLRVCEPMGATDPRVLLFLLIVFLLLLPLFSEVEVAGLFRVKKQVEEAEREVQGLRETVRTAQAQVATLSASVAATTVSQARSEAKLEYHHHDHRGEDSGEVQQQVLDGSAQVDATVGAYAQAAFTAGLAGLESLLVLREPAAMLFFTIADDGSYEVSQTAGEVSASMSTHALELVNADQVSSFADQLENELVVTSPAFDDDGSSLGAVAVVFAQEGPYPETTELQGLFADVSNLANAYARLLADLLGETGRVVTGSNDAEG